jgi:leucyl aminopeptidase
MSILVETVPLAEVAAEWLVVGVWQDEPLGGAGAALDSKLGGPITRLREVGDITGKANELVPFLDRVGLSARRLLVVGLGLRKESNRATITAAAAAAALSITGKAVDRLAMAVPENVAGLSVEETALAVGVGLMQGSQGPGIRKSEAERFMPKSIVLVAATDADGVRRGATRADIEGRAVALARELVNLPPCELYPESFAERARQAALGAGVEFAVLGEDQLKQERMEALLAVARGSERPPRLVVLRYRGAKGPTLGLVGKGVTFDSGGLSLKTNDQMVDMKCDMAGAAAVLAAVTAIAELKLPVDVLGVAALVENMPGSRAMKLGDVLKARNGVTIEVLNTDAEGRLILADALAYAVDQKVSHLVDLATLTGACMVALGEDVAGLMTNDDAWGERVRSAAKRAGEKVWPLPMFPLYGEMIKGEVADIRNSTGKRYAGAITAAKFLERFVADVPWVHLDIAGPAWADHGGTSRTSGGTGVMVQTLVELARAYGG